MVTAGTYRKEHFFRARERIVTCASRRQIILVSPEKLVQALGERGRIPVEIIPVAQGIVSRRLKELGVQPSLRLNADGAPFISDNHNLTLDCALPKPLKDGAAARELEARILQLAGVVDTGMFLGTAEQVLVGQSDGSVDVLRRA
jgi:ribose 5-phosphate isomerase A